MSNDPPVVQQRAQTPPGNIPKGRQTWIMVAVAVVIVLAVVFSGSGQPQQKTASLAPSMAANTASRAEIDRYTQALRIEEQRLRQAQAEASRSRSAFEQQIGAGSSQGAIPGQGSVSPDGQLPYPAAAPGTPVQPEKSAIEQDKEKREYASLFASNLALSYRKSAGEDTPLKAAEGVPEISADRAKPATPDGHQPPAEPRKAAATLAASHTLFEGTIVEAVLTNRLEGSFSVR